MDSLTAALANYYDTVPYNSQPFAQSAVEHPQVLAFLFGLDAAPPARACLRWAARPAAT